jgi:hypothetical protein
MELGISLGDLQPDPETDHDHSAGQYAEQGGLGGTRGLAASQVGDHGGERGLRRLSRDVVDQLGNRRSTKGSPGARSWIRSGFSSRSGNESGSALNGGKSGASTQPQWYSSNGVCG